MEERKREKGRLNAWMKERIKDTTGILWGVEKKEVEIYEDSRKNAGVNRIYAIWYNHYLTWEEKVVYVILHIITH